MIETINDLIKQVQEFFPEYNVTLDNVNDFYIMMEERGFDKDREPESQSIPGYYTAYEYGSFIMKKKPGSNQGVNTYSLSLGFKFPDSLKSASLNTFDVNSTSRGKIKEYINKFITDYKNGTYNKGLYMYGDFSIGKTYTLSVIHNELLKNNIKCIFTTISELQLLLKSVMATERYNKIIEALEDVSVLLLDDIGSENLTPWFRDEVLNTVFNTRLNNHKPVFFTSNVKPSELTSHLMLVRSKEEELTAQRIISRLTSLTKSVNMDDNNKYDR